MYLGRSTGCNGTPRSNTEITCCKLVCVSFSLICHLHFDQPKASHKEFLLKSITTVMLALTTPVMWTFVLICITGTHSHQRYSYSQPGCTPLPHLMKLPTHENCHSTQVQEALFADVGPMLLHYSGRNGHRGTDLLLKVLRCLLTSIPKHQTHLTKYSCQIWVIIVIYTQPL